MRIVSTGKVESRFLGVGDPLDSHISHVYAGEARVDVDVARVAESLEKLGVQYEISHTQEETKEERKEEGGVIDGNTMIFMVEEAILPQP